MKRFKNILLVLGESNLDGPAAQRAINMARSNQASLTIVDVLAATTLGQSLKAFSEKIEHLQQRLVRDRKDELEKLVSSGVADLSINVEVLSGKLFVEIIRYVLKHNFDLVIKAVEREKRFAAILFGSTDLRLMRKCPCPVWLVKAEDQAVTQRILAAVELEAFENEQEFDSLNKQIIEIASSLALHESSELFIVNAWMVFDGEDLAKKLSKHYEEDASAWVDEQRRSIENAQRGFRKNFEDHVKRKSMQQLNYSFHFLEGEAEDIIVNLAAEKDVDLVIMGTVARTDLAGFLAGNTSEAVLYQIDSSVLAVKPPGFISPVRIEEK